MIQERFAVALGFSTAAHVGFAWMVSVQAPLSAAPAQRALTVAMTPAAPRAVLNSIAPTAVAALSPPLVQPLTAPAVQVIEPADAAPVASSAVPVESLEAPLAVSREAGQPLRAQASQVSVVAVAAAPARPAAISAARPARPGARGSGAEADAAEAVAGRPGANRDALPVAGNEPPAYPWIARAHGHQGRVVLSVWVSARGEPERPAVLKSSGYPSLDRAAVDAVQHWRFQPARRGGQATESLVQVPVLFRLDDGG